MIFVTRQLFEKAENMIVSSYLHYIFIEVQGMTQ